jgi:hypothetical protein
VVSGILVNGWFIICFRIAILRLNKPRLVGSKHASVAAGANGRHEFPENAGRFLPVPQKRETVRPST